MDASDPLSLNLYTYCNNNPVMYVDPSGHWLLPALAIVGGILLATLTSCDNNDSETLNSEFYDPKSPMYDGGFWTYEEALQAGYTRAYYKAFDENRNSKHEYGVFIYSQTVPISLTKDAERFYPSDAYRKESYRTDIGHSIVVDPEHHVPKGAKINAFIHTHNQHKDENIFSDNDNLEYNMYVIDNQGYLYLLTPDNRYKYDVGFEAFGKVIP